jgi:thiamine pyrophosphate-dependent acetolactate synthase large subunit-like protein
LRKQVKKYIDSADEKTLKMMYAMLEAEQETDWWNQISVQEKAFIHEAIKQVERGQVTSHEEVMKNTKDGSKNSLV